MIKKPKSVAAFNSLMTVAQVAQMKGLTRHAVHMAIRSGRLPARQIGAGWFVRRVDAEAWQSRGGYAKKKGEDE